MAFVPKHNQVGFLKKPKGSAGFEQIVDFLKGTHIRYALEHNPTIYVSVIKQFLQIVTVITLDNGEQELKATIDTHEYTISESSVRNKHNLAYDNGITEFTNAKIFEGMANLGSKSGGWDQFGSKLATAFICLSTGRTYNFSKMIFEAIVVNVTSQKKFLMYPRFLSMILEAKPANTNLYLAYQLTKNIFGNMNKGFARVNRPLLANMIAGHDDNQELEIETELHGSSSDFVYTPPTEVETSSPEHTEHTFEQPSTEHQPLSPRQEPEALQSSDPSHPHVPEARSLTVEYLLHMVPTLITKVDSLETELKQTKQTMGKASVKLVKKVKKLENITKRRNVVLTTSEDEGPEDQGRIFKDIDDDPLVSFVTPTKPSGEAQEEEISPTTLEAAKTLSKVASQRSKSVDKGKRYKRRKEFKGKDFEDISTGFEEVNTGGLGFSIGSGPVSSNRGQREGKAPMTVEETQAPKRTKEQIQQEEDSFAKSIRLQNLEEEETAKQVYLDALLAKRLAEEEELTEQQKQRKAQVQFEAQHYTKEDWDAIRAKLKANAELAKSVIPKDMSKEDFAKRMVDLVNQRKKYFVEERAKSKRKEFDKLVKQVDTFVRMSLKAIKAELKRFGEELQTKTTKRKKIDDKDVLSTEEKEKEHVKKMGKRRKQVARKGLHTAKDEAEKEKASEEDDSSSGTNVPINPVPVAVKSPSIASYKIIKQGKKGVYQIVRENGTYKRYGTEGPTDDYERVFWENLKIIVHCLNLDSADIYMLAERKYPLSANVCQTMLKMKLLDRKMNEDCYKLLKMMEKQAGVKNDGVVSRYEHMLEAMNYNGRKKGLGVG
ncbi:hypothetical protein Tco_1092051 [Tanacetum coccineum]|uniref:Uncharacterized protein n=1 Tax=Tanacetum coccineum TaxID=301880 RepID=A0ABQ5IAW6_9ASTR